jgi:hypothetical protein
MSDERLQLSLQYVTGLSEFDELIIKVSTRQDRRMRRRSMDQGIPLGSQGEP